jgi:hypothetical protein
MQQIRKGTEEKEPQETQSRKQSLPISYCKESEDKISMSSTPPFSPKQLDSILVSGGMLGIYLCGLVIGEQLQSPNSRTLIYIITAVCFSIYFLWFITVRVLFNLEVNERK